MRDPKRAMWSQYLPVVTNTGEIPCLPGHIDGPESALGACCCVLLSPGPMCIWRGALDALLSSMSKGTYSWQAEGATSLVSFPGWRW